MSIVTLLKQFGQVSKNADGMTNNVDPICTVCSDLSVPLTVKILKFGTPQTIAIIVLKIEKFAVTLH